jgi:hypothetical protein
MGSKNGVVSMRAAVASLESTVRDVVGKHLSRAELVARELEAQRRWRIESKKRHVRRPSVKP